MSASVVKFHCDELRKSLLGVMDPDSSQQLREKAQLFCVEFKATSPLCIPCGLKLAQKTEVSVVQHFGFQILEDLVRFRWPTMSAEERTHLKTHVLGLIAAATAASIVEEEAYIKDSFVRVMVEMIKQEWPTSWPTMLLELVGLTKSGASQAELVLLILLRLVEDVLTFQRELLTSERIRCALVQNMDNVFDLVEYLLQYYINQYKQLADDPTQESQLQSCCRVIAAAANTLGGYMQWAPVCHAEQMYKLVKMLWYFLDNPKLQLEASECLLIAVDRIGGDSGTFPVLDFFADLPIQYVSPAQTADGEALTDQHYFFLKIQCHLVCNLIRQLCRALEFNASTAIPANFGKYLHILLDFTTHSSKFLSSLTQSTWRHLFSCALLSHNLLVLAMLQEYLHATMKNLVKVGLPSKNNSPSCEYSRLDFVCDADFCDFLRTFRDDQRMVIKAACQLDRGTCCEIGFEYLKCQVYVSFQQGPMNALTADSLRHASIQSFQQWEAVTFLVKVITEHMLQAHIKDDILVTHCIEMLHLVMNFKTKNPFILSCVQVNICTLFPFLNYMNEYSSHVLSELLDMIEENNAADAPSLKSVRRSVCASFIQLCRDNAQNLLDPEAQSLEDVRRSVCSSFIQMFQDTAQNLVLDFGVFNEHVKQLLGSAKLLRLQMEKGILLEAMLIRINQFKNYERQKVLLEELLAPITKVWLSEAVTVAVSRPVALVRYVGASLQLTDTEMGSSRDLNRSRVFDCVSTILGVLKWSRWPADLEEAKAGGFVISFMHDGRPLYRNPCSEWVQMVFNNICILIRTQHHLYMQDVTKKLSDPFAKALDLLEVENTSTLDLPQPLLDIYDPPEYKTPLEKMQAFFCTLYETCFSILAHAGSSMNMNFKDLHFRRWQYAFQSLELIPNYRLLSMVRVFLKPLLHSCPPECYESLLYPIIMKRFLDIFHDRLSHEWNIINQRNMASKGATVVENPDSQTILEDQVKLLTADAMEFLFVCCAPNEETSVIAASNGADCSVVAATSDDACCVSNGDNTVCTAESDDENEDPSAVLAAGFGDGGMAAEVQLLSRPASTGLAELGEIIELGTLGMCLLKTEATRSSLLRTAFSSLLWNHGFTCHTIATRLCWPLLKKVIAEPISEDDMTYVFAVLLQGIKKHRGDHFSIDALVDLAFHIYASRCTHCKKFHKVIEEVSYTESFYLETFDLAHFSVNIQKQDNMSKDDLRHLLEECTKKPFCKQLSDNCIHIPAPPLRKRKNGRIPVKELNYFPHPSKKLFLQTSSTVMVTEDDHFSDDDIDGH